jgi:hypothetical protein
VGSGRRGELRHHAERYGDHGRLALGHGGNVAGHAAARRERGWHLERWQLLGDVGLDQLESAVCGWQELYRDNKLRQRDAQLGRYVCERPLHQQRHRRPVASPDGRGGSAGLAVGRCRGRDSRERRRGDELLAAAGQRHVGHRNRAGAYAGGLRRTGWSQALVLRQLRVGAAWNAEKGVRIPGGNPQELRPAGRAEHTGAAC